MHLVYFSSTTNNTHRFVKKLGIPATRIPIKAAAEALVVEEPFILVCPTYGGGASITGAPSKPVPIQVIKFLNNPRNRSLIRGVIAGGNTNFGSDYGKAGDLIAAKCQVPMLYRFELMGTDEDIAKVQDGLCTYGQQLGLKPPYSVGLASTP